MSDGPCSATRRCGVDVDAVDLPGLDELAACASGCVPGDLLARFLAGLNPAQLATDGEVLDLVVAWDRLTSWTQAAGLRSVAEFARRPEAGPRTDPSVARAARRAPGQVARWNPGDEVAAALGVGVAAGERRVATACTLARRLAGAGHALAAGQLDLARVSALMDETAGCEDEVAHTVQDAVLAGGRRASAGRFRRAARAAVLRMDPAGAAGRSAAVRAQTFVRTRPADTDTAWLDAHLPAEDAAAIRTAVDAAALAMRRAPGEARSLDQLRAAALAAPFWAALASGELATPVGPVRLSRSGGEHPAVVLVPGEPSQLHGYGVITDDLARRLAVRSMRGARPVVRLASTEAAGSRTAGWPVEDAYEPSPAPARHVRGRDRSCRFPGCAVPAARCDVDHTVPWPVGPTHPTNLAAICRHHHRLKQRTDVRLTQLGEGRLEWALPTGHRRTTDPPDDG